MNCGRKTRCCTIGFFIVLVGVLATPLLGTEQDEVPKSSNSGAQYYLGSEDELVIKVNVWGFVSKPGQYLVPNNTDLVSLLSYVGGPLENANLKHIKLIRTSDKAEKVLRINVSEYLKNGNRKLIPKLLPEDTIIVPASKWYYVNKFFDFSSRVAIIVQIVWHFTMIRE